MIAGTNHFNGRRAKIQIRHRCGVVLQDIDASSGQGLDDRLVALKGGSLLSMKDESTHMTVELARQQQVNDGGFDVFLLILVCIKGVSKIDRDVIWKKICW